MDDSIEELTESQERASKIVSKVIDEYDVIEETDNVNTGESDSRKSRNHQPQQQSSDGVANSEPNSQSQTQSLSQSQTSTTGNTMNINSRNRLSSSEKGGSEKEEPHINVPKVNCKEKIIICIDVSSDMEKQTFRSRAGDKYSPQKLSRRALNFFLQSKERIDKNHEYAVVLLQETAIWAQDFSSNHKEILSVLDDVLISELYKPCETFDVTTLYDKIFDKVPLPKVEGDQTKIPPPYIVRVLFVYGRTNCLVRMSNSESMKLLNTSPYFFFDALYIHEPLSEENSCQEVFDSICDLDKKGLSYMLGASRNLTKLYDHMAQLLAHPLQRPQQGNSAYRIGSILSDDK